jgi:hypothetical protein
MRTLAAEFTDDDTDHVGQILIVSNVAFKNVLLGGQGCPFRLSIILDTLQRNRSLYNRITYRIHSKT